MDTSGLKTEKERVDGTPEKRMFWSIISDYGLSTGVCELIDNAIDHWMAGGRANNLRIHVELDHRRSYVSIFDNAGGVRYEDLRLLVTPGGSRNDPEGESIGIFGVGSKRAGVALGAHVTIKTRFKREASHQIDITDDWLENPDWRIPIYDIAAVEPGTTTIEITRLRNPFSKEESDAMRVHLGEVYSWFIAQGCEIKLNGECVEPIFFNKWSYPPDFPPRIAEFPIHYRTKAIAVEIEAGLIADRDPEAENYGVYFYCNNRLIAKEVRAREVGYFIASEAGVPHPDASLCRVVVRMRGPAEAMPWNSSKSAINYSHAAFKAIRPTLIQLVSHYSSLSRRLKDDWNRSVFKYTDGVVYTVDPEELVSDGKIDLPSLPRVNKAKVEKLKAANKRVIQDQPWTLGLIEAMAAIEMIVRQKYDTANRIALIILDSNFEIALKEFIVHSPGLFPPKTYNDAYIKSLFSNRTSVIDEIQKKKSLPTQALIRAKHYYMSRNKLIHERATVDVTDTDILNYKKAVQEILQVLFGVRFPR